MAQVLQFSRPSRDRRKRESLFLRFKDWGFNAKGWSPATVSKYMYRAKAADAWLVENRGVSFLTATTKDLQAYLFSTVPHARNRNQVRSGLVAFGEFLIECDIIKTNPALALPRLPQPRSIPKALFPDVTRAVLRAAKALGPMVHCLISLLFYEGLRRAEARTLEWSMVEGDFEQIRFVGKGSKDGVLPLHDRARASLMAWRVHCPDPRWVFPSPKMRGRPMSENHLARIVRGVGELAGVEGLHPHVLRHTFGTELMEALDGDLRTVQEAMRHADPKTTAIYCKVRPTRLREKMGKLPSFEGADN